MIRKTALSLFVVALALELRAQCALEFKVTDLGGGRRYEVVWANVPGATGYVLEEAPAGTLVVNRFEYAPNLATTRYRREFARDTTYDVGVTYRVTALGVPLCSGAKVVTYRTDSRFRNAMVRSVIPLVGSTPGANGALFRTSLRLFAREGRELRGRIVFHPMGVPASSSDPSLSFVLPDGRSVMEWPDIVTALGATGLGSLDIIPEPSGWDNALRVPIADVRIYNVTDQGTYGTIEAQVHPYAFHAANPNASPAFKVTVPGHELRLNMGVRTFVDSEVEVTVRRSGQVIVNRVEAISADVLQFTTAAAFTGTQLEPGDEIELAVRKGAGVPMYSLTDFVTNDPALFLPPIEIDYEVGKYQIVK